MRVKVIGAGLAGCEAAWQLAQYGIDVDLYEMKPLKYTPAHEYEGLAELVCSNSLKSNRIDSACGLLKEEMRRFDSLIIKAADATKVPAGGALAVDRNKFSDFVTEKLTNHDKISIIHSECLDIPTDTMCIIATGPLTSDGLADNIRKLTGEEHLHFYDAAAPVIRADSIDMSKAFKASRYGRGTDDYINCPMTEDEYNAFYMSLIKAETALVHGFEEGNVFEGCMPVEVMAKRGIRTLSFGPLKPVGLTDPRTGKRPWAVVQLRQDDANASMYNMVGFQTRLKFGEQKRVFGMIPGLENAEFLRYGVMHRNTYINSPDLLNSDFSMRSNQNLYFAGQITGVEGYVESAMSGMVAGLSVLHRLQDKDILKFSGETMTGALCSYISHKGTKGFQPMNSNFGIIPPLPVRIKGKKERYAKLAERSLMSIDELVKEV